MKPRQDDFMLPYKYDEVMESRKWMQEIPYIKFPEHWKVKITPPYAGAVIRFRVIVDEKNEDVSIYLDCYDRLGYFGEPYWEVYPYKNDVGRCAMSDIATLIEMIADRTFEVTQ